MHKFKYMDTFYILTLVLRHITITSVDKYTRLLSLGNNCILVKMRKDCDYEEACF